MMYPLRDNWTSEQFRYLEELMREINNLHGQLLALRAQLATLERGHQETVHE